MAEPNEGQRALLMNRLAEKHRIDMDLLTTLTMDRLRELWNLLENAKDSAQWAAAATAGVEAIVKEQQVNAASIASLLFFQSGDIYKKSGQAPRNFRPSTGDQKGFLKDFAPVIVSAAMREVGYHVSEVVKGNTTPEKAQRKIEGTAQEALMNTTREFITVESLKSAEVEAEEEVLPFAERYAPRDGLLSAEVHYAPEDDLSLNDISRGADTVSWLDEDFLAESGEAASFEEWTGYKEGETPEDLLTQKKLEEYKKEIGKPSPVETNVREGGCSYCKIVGIGKGPRKWHKHCNCVNLPKWKNFKSGRPSWEAESSKLYYKARAVAEAQLTDKNSYVTMDDIMREIRIMEYAEKNRERIANGEKPRKPYKRKPPKTLQEKQDTAMRNAANVAARKAIGIW